MCNVGVLKREGREKLCVCVYERESESERKRESVCVCAILNKVLKQALKWSSSLVMH